MEELFLSSAQGDSSLALPAEPARRSATKVGPKERSVRVQQQVQLTMARRARKSSANGKSCVFKLKNRFDNKTRADRLAVTRTKRAVLEEFVPQSRV